MKALLTAIAMLSLSQLSEGAESGTVPWAEFKQLYTESIVRNATEKKEPFIYTIEDASYHLSVDKEHVHGKVMLSGTIVSGNPEPIALFCGDIIIAGIDQVVGGNLLTGKGDAKGASFLSDGTREFQLELSFLVSPREDSKSKLVTFPVPRALKNAIALELSPEIELLEPPGIIDDNGSYHFSTSRDLEIRFRDKEDILATSLVDVDTFTRIRIQGKRAILTTAFAPAQKVPGSFVLRTYNGSQYISSSHLLKRMEIYCPFSPLISRLRSAPAST